ncbi:MAG: Xaa-Pro peptidase family protein [Methanocellales archaeon]
MIAQALITEKLHAFLMVSESMHNANMYYATKFAAPDPFAYIQTEKKKTLLVSQLEYERAKKESSVKDIRSLLDYGIREKLQELKDADKALAQALKRFFEEEQIQKIGVPRDFPAFLLEELRSSNLSIAFLDKVIERAREVKTLEEIAYIEKAQFACEEAMKLAREVIKRSKEKNGLLFKNGEPLTSEKIQSLIEGKLLKLGCSAEGTIVASGKQASDPHCAGTGYILSNSPVVIDIFPRLKKERYYADMTRTFFPGTPPSKEFKEMYNSVLKAQNLALRLIKPGVTGKEVHEAVCDSFAEDNYKSLRDGKISRGFLHSTGHGIGLSIHEMPNLNETGEVLREGSVITIEPGLYDPDVGGVRIEDVVVVTKKGIKNLTKFPKDW